MTKYGVDWPREWLEWQIELFCYRYPEKREAAGIRTDDVFHFRKAMRLLWPQMQWNEYMDMFTQAWCERRHIAVMGHTRATKTFSFAYIILANYLAAPECTRTVCTTVALDSLKDNLWANILEAWDTALPRHDATGPRIPLYHRMTDRELNASNKPKDRRYCIKGIATGEDKKAAGRIQGQHAERSIVLIDEAQQTGHAIFQASHNLESDPWTRFVYLGNPEDARSDYGEVCEPRSGWGSVSVEHRMWDTQKTNGVCIHLDGMCSPNVIAKEMRYPYLISPEFISDKRRHPGEDSPSWWAMVRGWWAPDGAVERIFSDVALRACESPLNLMRAIPCAALDPGFGGDKCAFMVGEYGRLAVDASLMGVNVVEKIDIPIRVGAKYDQPDFQIRDQVLEHCLRRRIDPENLICDSTGRGAAVVGMIRQKWDLSVQSFAYAGTPSERLLLPGDRRPCIELYDRKVSELVYAAAEFARSGQCGGVDPDLRHELIQRRSQKPEGRKLSVEPKAAMKKRVGKSPDDSDCFCQLVELIRRKGARVKGTREGEDAREEAVKKLARMEEEIIDDPNQFGYSEWEEDMAI